MEQKNYKLEIVRVLDRKGVHARGVAVRLGMNLGKLERGSKVRVDEFRNKKELLG